jgi:hypothetical protein
MRFKRLLAGAASSAGDVLAITGASCVTFGVCRMYLPAGFVVLGMFLIAGAVVIARTAGKDE